MKWPRGKYNGWRIVGIDVHMKIDVLDWWWKLRYQFGTVWIFVGPVHIWINPNYEDRA